MAAWLYGHVEDINSRDVPTPSPPIPKHDLMIRTQFRGKLAFHHQILKAALI